MDILPNNLLLRLEEERVNHQQWAEQVRNLIKEIELNYPTSSNQAQQKWKQQLKQIKQTCDHLLLSWATVEDGLAKIMHQYPDLNHEETDELEEEFFLEELSWQLLREGQGYYQLEMYDSAVPLLESFVQKEPDFWIGRVFLGLCYYQQKRWIDAKDHFDLITKMATSQEIIGFAYHMLGCIGIQMGEFQKAIRRFAKSIATIPDNPDSWFNLAICHYQLKQYEEAIPIFFQTWSFNRDDWQSMYYLSKCYHHLNQEENVEFWRLAAFERAHHPEVMVAIAQDYEERGEYEKAIRWYQRLLNQDRKETKAYRGLAWNYWMLKKFDQAVCWLKKGLSIDPHDSYLLSLQFWILLQQEQTEKMGAIIQLLPSQFTHTSIWNALLSRYFAQIGDVEQAIAITEELIAQENEMVSGLGYYQKGRILLEFGEVEEAIICFKRAREAISNWKDPIFYEGVCHLIQEEPNRTRDCWEKIDFYM